MDIKDFMRLNELPYYVYFLIRTTVKKIKFLLKIKRKSRKNEKVRAATNDLIL